MYTYEAFSKFNNIRLYTIRDIVSIDENTKIKMVDNHRNSSNKKIPHI